MKGVSIDSISKRILGVIGIRSTSILFIFCIVLLAAFFDLPAQLYDKGSASGGPEKDSSTCLLSKKKDMRGKGTKNDPYLLHYSERCHSILYRYLGTGRAEYFRITGLKPKKRYHCVIKRSSGKGSMMFYSTQNALTGIRTSRLAMQISNSFSTGISVAKKDHFAFSVFVPANTSYDIYVK